MRMRMVGAVANRDGNKGKRNGRIEQECLNGWHRNQGQGSGVVQGGKEARIAGWLGWMLQSEREPCRQLRQDAHQPGAVTITSQPPRCASAWLVCACSAGHNGKQGAVHGFQRRRGGEKRGGVEQQTDHGGLVGC